MKEVFREAAEIAAELPDSMQEAGFLRAVDVLLVKRGIVSGDHESIQAVDQRRKKTTGRTGARRAARGKGTAKKASKGRGGRLGAQASLRDLIDNSKYFESPRTIPEIVSYLDSRKAHKFKQSELSGPLGKLVRKGELEREKNKDGVYAYKAP